VICTPALLIFRRRKTHDQDTPKQQAPEAPKGKIQTGLRGRGGALGWLFVICTPALLIFRRRKTHDQAR
ncbi:MAG TPA: hypothetical protein PKZ52_02980, partial [Cellvibrionaceae bacterium]|nr:hypothetical protein [Cellvibrionaceae bacterium]